jgi:hypothetical protein
LEFIGRESAAPLNFGGRQAHLRFAYEEGENALLDVRLGPRNAGVSSHEETRSGFVDLA